MTDNDNRQRQEQIQQILQQINLLSCQLQLLILDNNNQRDFIVGDYVQITNNYQRLRGARGTITRVTPQRVYIELEGNSNKVVVWSKTNVILIQDDEQV